MKYLNIIFYDVSLSRDGGVADSQLALDPRGFLFLAWKFLVSSNLFFFHFISLSSLFLVFLIIMYK